MTVLPTDCDDIVIREALPEDAVDLLQYVHQISHESDFLSFGPGEFELTEEEEARFLRSSLEASNRIYFIALDGQRVVGTVNFSGGTRPRVCHTGELGLSVAQSHWSRGIGTKLMQHLISWAEAHAEINRLQLHVRVDNSRAIALYERMGFEREGTVKRAMSVNGVYFDSHLMGRDAFGV